MKSALSVVLVIAIPLVALSAGAQEATTDGPAVEIFEAPVAEHQPELPYPGSAARDSQEGWVELNFMVDTDGKAYEIAVAENVGDDVFVRAAIDHLEESVFTPARIGDQAVHGSAQQLYTFIFESDRSGARRSFVTRYRGLTNSLREGTEADALRDLNRLENADIQNIYEYSFLSLARYLYAAQYGSPLEQMDHLYQALNASDDQDEMETFLGDEPLAVRRNLFQLQVQNGYYGEAFRTLRIMKRKGDTAGIAMFQDAVEQLQALQLSDQMYGVAGNIAPDGYWRIRLFKDEFQFDEIRGSIAELKLRCQRSFVFFEFDPELSYGVSERAGRCWLQVTGSPDTTFTLLQY